MARRNFHHPFQPYDIQQEFMEAVHDCIEQSKVGIFESPTGTGKSLSLICGSLTWLREHKRKRFDESLAGIHLDDDEPEWVIEHAKKQRRNEARQMRADFEARLEAVRQKEEKIRERNGDVEPPAKKRRQLHDDTQSGGTDEDEFMLDEYDSDDQSNAHQPSNASKYSAETTKLMEKLGMVRSDTDRRPEEEPEELKIFFCSRTHSQLSQFAGELKRVRLPAALTPEDSNEDALEELKHLTLGSRKNLCINPKVSQLSNPVTINERCIELQQSNTPVDKKCTFLPKKDDHDIVLDFRDHALAKIRDIEDLAAVGSKLQICPYYAARAAIGPTEMVTLPYPLLLQKSAREALGISLKGHVVIIDEAHNLMSAIEGIHNAQVTDAQLRLARASLMIYLQKFRNRLKGANRVYVTQVVRIIDSLLLCTGIEPVNGLKDGPIEPSALLSGKGVDQINLAKLVHYISESKLARKVDGYVAHVKNEASAKNRSKGEREAADVPTLTHIQNFLVCLMNPSREGRFFVSREGKSRALRYLLLDPSEHFREIVEDARAVILAGGTMSPMDDFKQRLFPYVVSMTTLSCGHLIPKKNLLVRTIASDDLGPLEFSYKSRSNPNTATRVGEALLDLAPNAVAGLVVFFPSYGYLDQIIGSWRQQGLLERLNDIKPVFCDSRGGNAEETFEAYKDSVRVDQRGALLLSVIGGKLSEGINFSDDLGRCVVVVGLPFPNLETPEWKAKLQYIDDMATTRGLAKGQASREHAEDVCMRSVNQAIGRVIRHKDDWASILLMDSRYTQKRIKDKLPGWIKASFPESPAGVSTTVKAVSVDVKSFLKARVQ